VTTPVSITQPPFARLCQAALLIGRVNTFYQKYRVNKSCRLEDVDVLADEHVALLQAVDADPGSASVHADRLSLLAARSLARSSLFMLLDPFCGPEGILDGLASGSGSSYGSTQSPDQLRLHARADQLMDDLSYQARREVTELLGAGPPTAPGHVSPFILDVVYRAVGVFHCNWREDGDEVARPAIDDMVECLKTMSGRWGLASEYLTLERYHGMADSGQLGVET